MVTECMITLLFVVNVCIALLLIVLAVPMIMEKIKPNRWYGFRTSKTLGDEKKWYPANKYAGKAMVVAGIIIIILSALMMAMPRLGLVNFPASEGILITVWVIALLLPIIAMTAASFLYLRRL